MAARSATYIHAQPYITETNVGEGGAQSRALTFSSHSIATTAFADPPFSSWPGTPAPRGRIGCGGGGGGWDGGWDRVVAYALLLGL